jgi:hypothetical protein
MTVVDAESRFHVLAVDDSIIDRKLIEMLLKTSSYQGEAKPQRAVLLSPFEIFSLFCCSSSISHGLCSLALRSDDGGFREQGAGGPGIEGRGGRLITLFFLIPSPSGNQPVDLIYSCSAHF